MVAFKLRLPDALRTRLDQAAETSEQSLNSEIVKRLEASFSGGDSAPGEGGPDSDLLRALARAMQTAGGSAKRLQDGSADPTGWVNNAYAYEQATKAAIRLLELLRPAGAVELPANAGPPVEQMLGELGVHFANAMLGQTRNWGPSLIETLGPLADRLPKGSGARK